LNSLVEVEPDIVIEDEDEIKEAEKMKKMEEELQKEPKGEDEYDHLMEEYLDEMYEEYISHALNRTQRIKIGKKKKKEQEEENLNDLDDLQASKKRKLMGEFKPKVSGDILSSDDEEDKNATNSLIMKPEVKEVPASKRATMWFSQFSGLEEDNDEEEAIKQLKKKLGLPEITEKKEEVVEAVKLGPFFKRRYVSDEEEDGEEGDDETGSEDDDDSDYEEGSLEAEESGMEDDIE